MFNGSVDFKIYRLYYYDVEMFNVGYIKLTIYTFYFYINYTKISRRLVTR